MEKYLRMLPIKIKSGQWDNIKYSFWVCCAQKDGLKYIFLQTEKSVHQETHPSLRLWSLCHCVFPSLLYFLPPTLVSLSCYYDTQRVSGTDGPPCLISVWHIFSPPLLHSHVGGAFISAGGHVSNPSIQTFTCMNADALIWPFVRKYSVMNH